MDTVAIIKELAASKGLSLKQLALQLGFGENTIYRWNTKKPTIDKVQKVANYFHVSVDYLLGNDDTQQTDDPKHIDVEDIVNDSAMLTSRDHALSDEDKAAIRALVTTYLNSKEGQDRLRQYGGYGNDGNKINKE
ncbi:XRE family transcriptional regulator [Lactobacillus sp. CBA3605]|uniref:helix-turn-helix domain-containing protein n=1 Tax=Lactobacillus sp. CBA3605 TaxID=2099788 RepID=UPI000CFB259E|nr:helix-turn-helix transcriptional regulator [Lactobacillus sp. CBA3605]AVK62440.1 XRE family transcriptional regulator [Lactobacillus sp. CBA3605]